MKSKKTIVSKDKSVFTDTKISDIFLKIRNQMIQEKQQNEVKSSCLEKREIVEEEAHCNTETEEHLEIPMTSTDLMKEDE